MFYHVRVTAQEQRPISVQLTYDVEYQEAINEYVVPFKRNDVLFVNGIPFAPNSPQTPRRIEIWQTDQKASEYGITSPNTQGADPRFAVTTVGLNVTNRLFAEASSPKQTPQGCDTKKVFIVHGREKLVLAEVRLFLSKFGLEIIVLSDQPNEGNTIIQKFEKHTDVGFAVVLLTSDDVGCLAADSPSALKPRARENVIFELGYLMAKLGRDKVAPILARGMDVPSDLNGLGYISMDAENAWHWKLGQEMKAAKLDINLNLA